MLLLLGLALMAPSSSPDGGAAASVASGHLVGDQLDEVLPRVETGNINAIDRGAARRRARPQHANQRRGKGIGAASPSTPSACLVSCGWATVGRRLSAVHVQLRRR